MINTIKHKTFYIHKGKVISEADEPDKFDFSILAPNKERAAQIVETKKRIAKYRS